MPDQPKNPPKHPPEVPEHAAMSDNRYTGKLSFPACSDSVTDQSQPDTSANRVTDRDIPKQLSPELTDHLLGKAPLRLIDSFRPVKGYPHTRIETLECGHTRREDEPWIWDEGSHLVYLGFKARRRRCAECKAFALSPGAEAGSSPHSPHCDGSLSPRKPVQSVGLPVDKEAVNKKEEEA